MANIPYNKDIPNAPNKPSVDQPKMKTNTNSIDDLLAVDHISFNTANGGYHKQVRLIDETIPSVTVGQSAIYSKTSGQSQIFNTSNGGGKEYQITRFIDASFSSFGTDLAYGTPPAGFTQIGGWTFLPGGLLMQYGFYGKSGDTGSSGTIQFPVTWEAGPLIYSIQLSLYRNSGNQEVVINSSSPPTTTDFKFLCSSSGSDGIYWIAIGK